MYGYQEEGVGEEELGDWKWYNYTTNTVYDIDSWWEYTV